LLKEKSKQNVFDNLNKFSFLFFDKNSQEERSKLAADFIKHPQKLLLSLPDFKLTSRQNSKIIKSLIPSCNDSDIIFTLKKLSLTDFDLTNLLFSFVQRNAKNVTVIQKVFNNMPDTKMIRIIHAGLKSPNSYLLLGKSTCNLLKTWLQIHPGDIRLINFEDFM